MPLERKAHGVGERRAPLRRLARVLLRRQLLRPARRVHGHAVNRRWPAGKLINCPPGIDALCGRPAFLTTLGVLFALTWCLGVSAASAVVIGTTERVAATSSDPYIGVGLDLWRRDDPKDGARFGNASALRLGLLSPRLRNLAAASAPAVLRIGGSPEDSLGYGFDGHCASEPASAAAGGYYCSRVRPTLYDCLTIDRWQQLNEFADGAGLRLVFGLNACLGRASRDSAVDIGSLRRLLLETRRRGMAPFGFELGNELDGVYSGSDGVDPAALARDFAALAKTIASIWAADPKSLRPRLLGPDIAAFTGGTVLPGYFEQFLAALPPPASATLHALTFHQYPYCAHPDADAGTVLSLGCLKRLDTVAAAGRKWSQTSEDGADEREAPENTGTFQ